jgi:hypothetical protein
MTAWRALPVRISFAFSGATFQSFLDARYVCASFPWDVDSGVGEAVIRS